MSTDKIKTVNYRRCDPIKDGKHDPDFDLQALLEKVLTTAKRPWKRNIGLDGSRSLHLKMLVKKSMYICGTLVISEANRRIPLVDIEKDGETWEGVVDAKDNTGKKRNIQDRALYFAVRQNHVAIIQTKELNVGELQGFLNWLICEHAKLAPGTQFYLSNLPSKSAAEKLKHRNIKSIQIGKDAFTVEKQPVGEETEDRRRKFNKVITPDPVFMNILKAFAGDDAIIPALENSKDPGGLYVTIEINYKGRKKKDSQDVMRAIAATVGDNEELSPTIHLAGTGKISGDELTIKAQLKVQCPDGNVSQDDAMTKIANWLWHEIGSGSIVLS